jgi:GTP cyclohydrolase FolE2
MSERTSIPAPERLPRNDRAPESFAAAFGSSREETIASMDRAGDDVPDQAPRTPLPVQRIGFVREAIPVSMADPFDPASRVQVSCRVEAHTELDAERRGIHVSRAGDLLARLSGEVFPSLQDYAVALAACLRETQGTVTTEVSVRGVLSYVERIDTFKERSSIEHLELQARAVCAASGTNAWSGVGFHHMTACPCVQQTLRHARDRDADASPSPPRMTHSQRCHTLLTIGGQGGVVPLTALLAIVDAVVVRSRNTLPRDAELLAVHRAHASPMFLEDVLRDLLAAVHQGIREIRPDATIAIASTSMESIHDFDLSGRIEATVSELDRTLPPVTAR